MPREKTSTANQRPEPPQHTLQAALKHYQAGRLPQAEAICRQILQAEPNQPDALNLLGVIAYHDGVNDIAVELISRAILIKPSGYMYNNLGLAYHAQGKFDTAVQNYHKALSFKPNDAMTYNNLGNALQAQGKMDEAVESYRKALELMPNYAEAYSNMGLALHAQGEFHAAIESYRKALSIKPNNAMTYNNLGNTLQAQDRMDEAVESYRKALELMPDYAEAHSNMGLALQAQNKPAMAIISHQRALQLTESHESKLGFVHCIRGIDFTHETAGIRPLVIRAISEPWGRPSDLVMPSLSLIRLNHDISECIDRAANAWPTRLSAQKLFGPSGFAAVANDQLLQCLLENTPVNDVKLERFLTMARHAMLDAAAGIAVSDVVENKALSFYCSLSRQCFITEYVFTCTDNELDQARLLREQLNAALASGSPIPALWPIAVAAYFPLLSLSFPEALLNLPWPEPVNTLLEQQVREPMEELQLRAGIPSLTAIEDGVSILVQQQYEENPYPRWVKLPPGNKATTVDAFLHKQFPLAPFRPLGKAGEIDILIAGCGTGQHPIGTAQQFSCARILAVDLSLTSISYAKRKALELGLENIEFAHADIMKLGAINQKFDVIESVGVLHHMADPMAGWRILLSLLRPGGFMYLGFYSELGRQDIVKARSFIAECGYASNAEDIRRCRQDLMDKKDDTHFSQLVLNSDFYGISACRDMIFHIQEHRYTLPQLKENMEKMGLDFLGFSLDPGIIKQYRKRFPDDESNTNLDYWNIFEIENPNAFACMYQFWVQKRG